MDYQNSEDKKSIIKTSHWKGQMQKLHHSNLEEFKNNGISYGNRTSTNTGLVFRIAADTTNNNYRTGIEDELYVGCDDEERLRTISMDSDFNHRKIVNEQQSTLSLSQYIDSPRLYFDSLVARTGYVTSYRDASGEQTLLKDELYSAITEKPGIYKETEVVGIDLLLGKNNIFDTCIKYDNDYQLTPDSVVRDFGNNRQIHLSGVGGHSTLKTNSVHSTNNYKYQLDFLPKTDLTNKVLPDIVKKDICGNVCLQGGLTTRPRILEEGNLFEEIQPYSRSHGKLATNGKNSIFNTNGKETSQLDSLTLEKNISSIFNIKNNEVNFEADMIEITRIEHSYRLMLKEDPTSVEQIDTPITDTSGDTIWMNAGMNDYDINTILSKIPQDENTQNGDINVWKNMDVSGFSYTRHLTKTTSPVQLTDSIDTHFLSELDNYPAGFWDGTSNNMNQSNSDCRHKIKILVEPVPIGVDVSAPIKKSYLNNEYNLTHSTNVGTININTEDASGEYFGKPLFKSQYGLPRANNNPVSIPCATGATLYNYLMNVTQYNDLLKALEEMYVNGNAPPEGLENKLLELLNLPDDPTLLNAEEIKNKMIQLYNKLKQYNDEMVNYNTNQYIGYLIKCEKDLSDPKHPNATKYTVLRDRLVVTKDSTMDSGEGSGEGSSEDINSFDIIDINSSIFGYDMAQLQLPDTNIVFRDQQHVDASGSFNLIGITGVNGMTLELTRPDLSESDEYYYIVRYKKDEGMDLSVKVSVVDNVELVSTDQSGHQLDYGIIDKKTQLLATGRGPMLISGEDNSFTQNQEMCNRALNIWAMDGYNYTNNMNNQNINSNASNGTDWFQMKDKQFKTGLERFGGGKSTNQRKYNYRPVSQIDMAPGQTHPKGKSQLFINLFLTNNNEFTGQIPITLKDDILYRYYWDAVASDGAYYFDIKQTKLVDESIITRKLKDGGHSFNTLCNNSTVLSNIGLVKDTHYSTYVGNIIQHETKTTVELRTDSKQLIREYTSFKDISGTELDTPKKQFREYGPMLDKSIACEDKRILSFDIEKYQLPRNTTDVSGNFKSMIERYEGDGCSRSITPIFRYPLLYMSRTDKDLSGNSLNNNSRVVKVIDSGNDILTDINGNVYMIDGSGNKKTRDELSGLSDLSDWVPVTKSGIGASDFVLVPIRIEESSSEGSGEGTGEGTVSTNNKYIHNLVNSSHNGEGTNFIFNQSDDKLHLTFSHQDSYYTNNQTDDGFNLFVDKLKIHSCNYYNNNELALFSDNAGDKNSVYSLNPEINKTDSHEHKSIFDYTINTQQSIISTWRTSICSQNDYIRLDTIDTSGNSSVTVPLQVKPNLDINLNETTNNIIHNIVKRSNLTIEIDADNKYHVYDHDTTNISRPEKYSKTALQINNLPYLVDSSGYLLSSLESGVYKNCVLIHYNVDCNIIEQSGYDCPSTSQNINDISGGKHNYFTTLYGDNTGINKHNCIEDFNLKLTINDTSGHVLLRGYGQNKQDIDNDLTTTRHFVYPLDKFKITTESTVWTNGSGTYTSNDMMTGSPHLVKMTNYGDIGDGDVSGGNQFDLTHNFTKNGAIVEHPVLTGMFTNHGGDNNTTNVVYEFGTQRLQINTNGENKMIKEYYDSYGNLCLDGESIPGVINEITKLFTLKSSTNNNITGLLKTHTKPNPDNDDCWLLVGGEGNNKVFWEYNEDNLWYRCFKNTEHKMVIPMNADLSWKQLHKDINNNTDTKHGNITVSRNINRTFFPAGHKSGSLYCQAMDEHRNQTYNKQTNVDYIKYGDVSGGIPISIACGLPHFEFRGPKLEYNSTKRTYHDTVGSDGSHFTNKSSEWVPLEDTHRWITSNNDTHQLDYLVGDEFKPSIAQYRYYLPELYTTITADPNKSIYSLYDQSNHLTDKEVVLEVNNDQLDITYDTRLDPTPTERYTATNVTWKEEKWNNFADISGGFTNGVHTVLNNKLHGSLTNRFLYRLNSRLPYRDPVTNKIIGLKSLNRLNLLDNDMIISMWHNIRTVTGVSRDYESVDKLNDNFFNRREAMNKIDEDTGNLAGFGKKIEYNTDIEFKNMKIDASGMKPSLYKYQHIRNDIPGEVEPEYTMSSVNGSELISIDKSNWRCYAVSTPMPIYKKLDSNGKVSYSAYEYDPYINYNINRYDQSGEKMTMYGYDADIFKLEKHRIDYLRQQGMISNNIDNYFTYGVLNKYKIDSIPPVGSDITDGLRYQEPDNSVFECERKLGIKFKLGTSFNLDTGSTYLVDSITNGIPTAKWNNTFLRTSGSMVDGSIDISLSQPHIGDENVDKLTKLLYRNSYDTFTKDSTYLHYRNNDPEDDSSNDDLTIYYNPYSSYCLEDTDKKYELNIPDITDNVYISPDKRNDIFMSSRASWLCSKGINLWYRDCYRSLDLQSNKIFSLKKTVEDIIDEVLREETDSTTRKRMLKIQSWFVNYSDSLNLGDLLKVTLHIPGEMNNGKDAINKINNLTCGDDANIHRGGDGSNWNLWPEPDSNNKNITSNKICNISEIISKYIGLNKPNTTDLIPVLNKNRKDIVKYLKEYDDQFDFCLTDATEINTSYNRIDPDSRIIKITDIHDENTANLNINNIVDETGAKLYEDHESIPIRIVRTSHPPGLEHRLDEVESILDNKLSTIPMLEDRLNGIEGMVRDYENIKTYLASEINNLKNTKIEEQMDNIEQIDQLKQYVSNEIGSIRTNNNNGEQIKYDILENNINTILHTDNSSISKRIDILETNNRQLTLKIEQLDNTNVLQTMENNMNNLLNIQPNINMLSNTVNDLASKIDNNDNKDILNQMVNIKQDILGMKEEVVEIKNDITTTGQKIKKVIKKANIRS